METDRPETMEMVASKFRKTTASVTELYTPRYSKEEEYEFNVLDQMRRSGQMCDALLRIDNKTFKVHRAVLAAASPYFKALFTHTGPDVRKQEIIIPDVTPDIMERIIEHAYVRRTSITPENIQRLLPAADQFHVTRLLEDCCKFMESQLDPENCLGIRHFARTYFCHGLESRAHHFALTHFPHVARRSQELLMLTPEELHELLASDELNARSEELVFECILRWLEHAPEKRSKHVANLLNCVRLGLLNTQYFIEKVKNNVYIRDNEACRNLVIEAFRLLCDLDTAEDGRFADHPLTKPRLPHEIIIAIGGWSGGSPTNVIEVYDCRADRWIDVSSDKFGPRAYHGSVTFDGQIYVVGGFDGIDYFNSVLRFNPRDKSWKEVAPMHDKRCYVSAACHAGLIYAMGGFNGNGRQSSAEKYTPTSNQWTQIASMNHQRSDASATSLQDKIFIAGGFNGMECLSSAEYYDPVANQWTLITPMRNRRSGVSVVAHDGNVYVIGGFNGISRLNNGERWNPKTSTWSNIAEMYTPRSNYGIEVVDDMVFVIGGFNGVTTIHNVECYDPANDVWYDCADMGIFRSALSACVIRDPESVAQFIRPLATSTSSSSTVEDAIAAEVDMQPASQSMCTESMMSDIAQH